ncbi:hypothetical protein DFH11DRAFT_1508952 [Phellopilus nigrolimitatus]|nr:hypothetical protein DFH11DRAFT_1508952 [Phellopilus nigrolimitatus]
MNDTNRAPVSTKMQSRTRHGVVPLGSGFVVALAVSFSILFILSISLAFVNQGAFPSFRDTLNEITSNNPGIVLLGENVDVDVDEPSVSIRWSTLGCGAGFILPGSPLLHGSSACGLPAIPLEIFIDEAKEPVYSYDPKIVPTDPKTNQRSIVHSLIQFDSDHILDVHSARLYPFDTYLISFYMRATSSNSSDKDIPTSIIGLPVLGLSPSFSISSFDTEVSILVDDSEQPAMHLQMSIVRPGDARTYAMLIFGINWILSHFNFGIVILTMIQNKRTDALKQLAGVLAVLLVIPQLRDVMPDGPGGPYVSDQHVYFAYFFAFHADTIGFFPQMTLAGLSAVMLMLIVAKRELERSGENSGTNEENASRGFGERFSANFKVLESYGRLGIAPLAPRQFRDGAHSRQLSTRDVMLARVMRVLEAGSQAFSNNSLGTNPTRSKSRLEGKLHVA